MSIVVTLLLIGGVGYVLIHQELHRGAVAQTRDVQRMDVRTFQALVHGDPKNAWREIGDYVKRLNHHGVSNARLVGPGAVVVAANSDALIGTTAPDPSIHAALSRGSSYVGSDRDGRERGQWSFVTPVTLGGQRYAYSIDFAPASFIGLFKHIQTVLIILALIGLAVGPVLFYLLGGRALMRSHGRALERAWLDGLTDLPNRRAFEDRVTQAAAAAQGDSPLSLGIIDIDDFGFINHRRGYVFGDQLLRRVASVLNAEPSEAYRVGGDEFAVLRQDCEPRAADELFRDLVERLSEAGVSVTIGVSTVHEPQGGDVLFRQARASLLEAKRAGDPLASYEEIGQSVELVTNEKRNALRRLLDDRSVSALFQPIWDLGEGRLLGLEALCRLGRDCGLSGPEEAFDVAAEFGHTRQLDQLCVEQALLRAPDMTEGELLFLNISPYTLDITPADMEWLLQAVDDYGRTPSRVVIEVTERFIGRTKTVVESLHWLRRHGFKIALDDVGTGNAGLAMLRDVAPDFVKLDRSIVTAAGSCPEARGVLLAMAIFASETGAFVIAEGIEDDHVLEFLNRLDHSALRAGHVINGGQGYGLGRPGTGIPEQPPALLAEPQPLLRAECVAA